MTVEENLKQMILENYKTVQEFANVCKLKYTTVVSILNRGVLNANVQNIFIICQTLGLDPEEMAKGRLTTKEAVYARSHIRSVESLQLFVDASLDNPDITLDNVALTEAERKALGLLIRKAVEFVREMRPEK